MSTIATRSPQIRPATRADCQAIADIYNHYVVNTVTTFEEAPVSAREMESRIAAVEEAGLCWLVAEADGAIQGYAYAGVWNNRCAYRETVEITVYLQAGVEGRGVGSALYGALFDELRHRDKHAVIAGIALPNDASIALHEKFGLEKVALFREVGYKFGRWIDVGYWQLLLHNNNQDTS